MKKRKPIVILENVLVEDYAAEGKSIARVDGKVIFIEKAIPGDIVDVQLIKNKKGFAEGFPLLYKKYSVARVQPFCKHFGTCGGCQWQMLPYEQQLKYKHQQVIDNLTRIAKVQLPEISPIIGASKTTLYRNKLEFTFATEIYYSNEEFKKLKTYTEEERLDKALGGAGFHAKGMFNKIVEIEHCHLQEEPTNAIRNAVIAFTKQHHFPCYNIKQHTGWIRNMMIRVATTGEVMVNVVVAYNDEEMIGTLMNFIEQQFPEITTLLYTVNVKFNDSIYDLEPQIFSGKGFITERLGNYQFKVGPKSFFQTNTQQAEVLYNITKDYCELNGTQTVYDLYCGTGSIGIFVSKDAKKIIGVETVDEAIEDAKENAALNNINHASFFSGDVIKICTTDFFAQHGKPDVIITDPPRVGMHEKLVNKLLEIEAPIIVYVSCNPATQARDLALLDEKYKVIKVQPVDMFPHTLHIENVVQLKLK